jgi:hypothetical protein
MRSTVKKEKTMDGDSQNLEKNTSWESSDSLYDDRSFLQSFRLRHRSVLADRSDWDVMESELRLVLLSGVFLWAIHILSLAL